MRVGPLFPPGGIQLGMGVDVKNALISHLCFPNARVFLTMRVLRVLRRAEWFVRLRRTKRRWITIARSARRARIA